MTGAGLRDILVGARQESHRMRHFYLGVEHLFIALLEIKGGLLSHLIAEHGFATEYVIDAIRRKIAKGSRQRLWAGVPNTPRTDVILGIAHELAREDNRQTIDERDLLCAILDEEDNIPVRVLQALRIDTALLRQHATTRQTPKPDLTFVKVEIAPTFEGELTKDHLFILRRMFQDYPHIRVDARLNSPYSNAVMLIITPISTDTHTESSVVVKLGPTNELLDEIVRYEKFVRNTLPSQAAYINERPITPESSEQAALKYVPAGDDYQTLRDLKQALRGWATPALQTWLQDKLFTPYAPRWWSDKEPYRFEVWQEYDWLLPPILTLEIYKANPDDQVQTLRNPVKRARIAGLPFGEIVALENFVVQKIDHDERILRLAITQGEHAPPVFQVEVRQVDFDDDAYFRGEVIDRIVGKVARTRDELLRSAARNLIPDFDIESPVIPVAGRDLLNPLLSYRQFEDEQIVGTSSTIHGEMHLGNILIGPEESAVLIDFERTREGHTLFDWAMLEMSLLTDYVLPNFGAGWNAANEVVKHLHLLTPGQAQEHSLPESVEVIKWVRTIVASLLADPARWEEYFAVLAMTAISNMTRETISLDKRRLMLLVAALAMNLYFHYHAAKPSEQPVYSSDTRTGLNNRME